MIRSCVLAAALTLGLAACSSNSSVHAGVKQPSQPVAGSRTSQATGSCRADIGPTICVTAHLIGAVTFDGTATTTAPVPPDASPKTTCKQLAVAESTERDLGGNVASLGGHALVWDESLGHFTGAGRYDLSASDFYVSVDSKAFQAHHSTASVTITPDFATTFSFRDLRSDSGMISGTLAWTCQDPT